MKLRRFLSRLALALGAGALLFIGSMVWYALAELPLAHEPVEFTLLSGSSLRSVAQQMTDAGVLPEPVRFEILARALGKSLQVKAGNYEIEPPLTPLALLEKITRGDYTQAAITFVEGATFRQMRDLLQQQAGIKHDTAALTDVEIMRRLGADSASAEGWFFPDTYYFSAGGTDLAILRRAYRLMQRHLEAEWEQREADVPLARPYDALILASIVEKETGRPEDRRMVAAVFLNRIRRGMKLQTDPTVIYGIGDAFDGNLRKRDLVADHSYNTYTRAGLPPTPIAMPSLASLHATLHPAKTDALYFVAKGDGTSHFSRTLEEHERAVTRWQKSPHR